MKRIILLIFCVCGAIIAKSQPNCPDPFGRTNSINRFHIGAGVGLTQLKGDREMSNAFGIGGYLNADYQIINGLFAGLRSQFGTLKMAKTNNDSRFIESRYVGFGAGFLIHPFMMIYGQDDHRRGGVSIGKDLLTSFYLGADILNVTNNIKSIYRGNPVANNAYGPVDHYDGSGNPVFKDKVNALILPALNIGIAPILNKNKSQSRNKKNYMSLVLNAQFNFANNDDLDGYTPYDQNRNRIDEKNDFYSFYSLGLRYSF